MTVQLTPAPAAIEDTLGDLTNALKTLVWETAVPQGDRDSPEGAEAIALLEKINRELVVEEVLTEQLMKQHGLL